MYNSYSFTKIQSASKFNSDLEGIIQRFSYDQPTSAQVAAARIAGKNTGPRKEVTPGSSTLLDVDFRLTPTPQRKLNQTVEEIKPFQISQFSEQANIVRQQSSGFVHTSNGNAQSLCRMRSPTKQVITDEQKSLSSNSSLLKTQDALNLCNVESSNQFLVVQEKYQVESLPLNEQPQQKRSFENEQRSPVVPTDVKMTSSVQDLSSIKLGEDSSAQNQSQSAILLQQAINQISPIDKLVVKEFCVGKENLPPQMPQIQNQTPQFATLQKGIPNPPKFNPSQMAAMMRKPQQVSTLVQFQWDTLGEVKDNSIYSCQVELDQKFQQSLAKHFQKKNFRKPLTQNVPTPQLKAKLEGVFDYQRSIIIQTSMLRNKIDKETLYKIDSGSLDVNFELLHCILSIYPKESEVKLLVRKLAELGLDSFSKALEAVNQKELRCEPIEHFMLELLAFPTDLKLKTETLVFIQDFAPQVNELILRINCWKVVFDQLEQGQFLKDIVGITMRLGMFLNSQTSAKAFQLPALLRLFEMKSTLNKDKSAYHIVMKQYLSLRGLQWLELPDEIMPEMLIQEIRNLVPQEKLVGQLKEIDQKYCFYERMVIELPPGDKFCQTLTDFCQFYSDSVREQLLFFSKLFQSTISNFTQFLLSNDILPALSVIVEFANKHQKFTEQIKKTKAYKQKNRDPNPKSKQKVIVSHNPVAVQSVTNFTPTTTYDTKSAIPGNQVIAETVVEQHRSPQTKQILECFDQKKISSKKSVQQRKSSAISAQSQQSANSNHSPGLISKLDLKRTQVASRLGSPLQQASGVYGQSNGTKTQRTVGDHNKKSVQVQQQSMLCQQRRQTLGGHTNYTSNQVQTPKSATFIGLNSYRNSEQKGVKKSLISQPQVLQSKNLQ